MANGVDYVDRGRGAPVVFSHGGASDLSYWEPQRAAFARRHRFIAYSQPPQSADPAGDLIYLIRAIEAGPVHLIGFSSATALRTTLRAPELVRSLVIIEPNVPWLLEADADGLAILKAWRHTNDRLRLEHADDEELRAKLWFEMVNNSGHGTFDAQPESFRRMWLENFGARRAAAPAERLDCAQLALIGAPTLALGAEHGILYSRAILDRLAACIPVRSKVIVAGVTHFMSYQAPSTFNQLVMGFIDSLGSAASRP